MVAALKFFLGQDEAADNESDDEDDDDFKAVQPSKAEVYKANSKVRALLTAAVLCLSAAGASCDTASTGCSLCLSAAGACCDTASAGITFSVNLREGNIGHFSPCLQHKEDFCGSA